MRKQNAKKAQERAVIDQQQTLAQLIKWCKAHYGEDGRAARAGLSIYSLDAHSTLRTHLPATTTTTLPSDLFLSFFSTPIF